ncbi:MAG: WbqC family protein [Bacteroidota bacterium]
MSSDPSPVLAIRPPEYFPRLEYLALMQSVDRFVVADTVPYSRQSYQNRTKVRNPAGWQWLSVPLQGGQRGEPISGALIDTNAPWPGKHFRGLEYNYRTSPYFEFYEADLAPIFGADWTTLGALTVRSVQFLTDAFDLDVEVMLASTLPGRPDSLDAIWAALGKPSLRALPDTAGRDARALGIDLDVLDYASPTYHQNFPGFEPDLSALDALFNHGPAARGFL